MLFTIGSVGKHTKKSPFADFLPIALVIIPQNTTFEKVFVQFLSN